MNFLQSQRYRDIIEMKLKENATVRGYKSRLAQSLKIANSYLTQILRGEADLSLDQASMLCDFWQLDDRYSDYFITLVSMERASTENFRKRLSERLKQIRGGFYRASPINYTEVMLQAEDALVYFSNWYYCMIRASLAIPQLTRVPAIARRLGLLPEVVEKALTRMETMKLVRREGETWFTKEGGIVVNYLPHLKGIFCKQLRDKAVDSYMNGDQDAYIASKVFTLSREQYQQLKNMILEFDQQVVQFGSGKANKEEEVCVFSMDLYRVGRA